MNHNTKGINKNAAKAVLNALRGDTSELKKHLYHDADPIIWERINEKEVEVSALGVRSGTYTNEEFEDLCSMIRAMTGDEPKLIEIRRHIISKKPDGTLVVNIQGYPITDTPYKNQKS